MAADVEIGSARIPHLACYLLGNRKKAPNLGHLRKAEGEGIGIILGRDCDIGNNAGCLRAGKSPNHNRIIQK